MDTSSYRFDDLTALYVSPPSMMNSPPKKAGVGHSTSVRTSPVSAEDAAITEPSGGAARQPPVTG